MRTRTDSSLAERHDSLLAAQHEAEAEALRLAREEQFLAGQVRQAREQVRYYEDLLVTLRRENGQRRPLAELVRRLG